jgi:polyisoprenoid-binding protein YceI
LRSSGLAPAGQSRDHLFTGQSRDSKERHMTTASPAPSTTTAAVQRWTVDQSHTNVSFTVRHMMITNVRGEFQKVSGEALFDPARPEQSRINVSVDISSINTRDEKRDAHLRSADFFDAEKFPTLTFASKSVRRSGGGYEVVGDLSIRGVTREIVLTVDDVTGEHADPWGNHRIGVSAHAKIKRSDWGMMWNAALEMGGVLVADDVNIHIDAELVKAK